MQIQRMVSVVVVVASCLVGAVGCGEAAGEGEGEAALGGLLWPGGELEAAGCDGVVPLRLDVSPDEGQATLVWSESATITGLWSVRPWGYRLELAVGDGALVGGLSISAAVEDVDWHVLEDGRLVASTPMVLDGARCSLAMMVPAGP